LKYTLFISELLLRGQQFRRGRICNGAQHELPKPCSGKKWLRWYQLHKKLQAWERTLTSVAEEYYLDCIYHRFAPRA